MTEDPKVNKTVLHVFDILDAINDSGFAIGVSELTRKTGLPKTTVFRLLTTLEEVKAVSSNSNQQYTVGPRVLSYMKSVDHQNSLVSTAIPYMKEFVKETKENINIGVLYENQVLYLHSEQGDNFSLQVNLFPIAPLYCSSMGKLFLNDFSNDELNGYLADTSLKKRTINTITTGSALKDELAKVKQSQRAFDNEEYEYGLSCLAVPLLHDGKLIAAASVSGPTSRIKARGWQKVEDRIVKFGNDVNSVI